MNGAIKTLYFMAGACASTAISQLVHGRWVSALFGMALVALAVYCAEAKEKGPVGSDA